MPIAARAFLCVILAGALSGSLCTPALGQPAGAGLPTLQDIYNSVQTSISRSTQARDYAADARDNAANARDSAFEIRDTIRTALATLSTQMRQVIAEAVQDATTIIQEELAGRDAFINGSECPAFRQKLVALLQRLEALMNALAVLASPNAPLSVSFQTEIQIVQAAPCRALFPLYRVLTAIDFVNQNLIDSLGQATSGIVQVTPAFRDDDLPLPSGTSSPLDYEMSLRSNQSILAAPGAFRATAGVLRGLSVQLEAIGMFLQFMGQRGVFKELEVQIHGYVGTAIKNDPTTKTGLVFSGIGTALGQISAAVTVKVRHAMVIGSMSELRDNQLTILTNQQTILANQSSMERKLKDLVARLK